MHHEPAIATFVTAILVIVSLGMLMRWLKQPHVVVYLLTGFLLGPAGFGVIQDQATLARIGSFGVLFLLFFIGMEVTPRRLIDNWFISVAGTLLQMAGSVFLVFVIGWFQAWNLARILLVGFVISLSSTALVLKLLEEWGEMPTRVGQNALGILLVQDILLIPILIILGFAAGSPPTTETLMAQIIGGIAIVVLIALLLVKQRINLPWLDYVRRDREMQLFTALGICFSMALVTSLLGLSAALGAFVAGMVIASATQTDWVGHSLASLRTLTIALFFVSIGMLIDWHLLRDMWLTVSLLVLAAFLTNTFINAGILYLLGENRQNSLYAGALLAQIGEFSFVIASMGFESGIIGRDTYELTIAVISLTLILGPLWIMGLRYSIGLPKGYACQPQNRVGE